MNDTKIFDHPNKSGFLCPICNTDEDKPVVLIGINGTESGNIMKAEQVHHDCLLNNALIWNQGGVKAIVVILDKKTPNPEGI